MWWRARVAADLRAGAAGWLRSEAAVELLIRSCGGVLVQPDCPWLQLDDNGRYRLWWRS
jgi:hypothetical protein